MWQCKLTTKLFVFGGCWLDALMIYNLHKSSEVFLLFIPGQNSTCEEQQSFHSIISFMVFLLTKNVQRSLALRLRKCVQ